MGVITTGPTLGEIIRRYRDRRNSKLSNRVLADQLGVSEATLSRLLADKLPRLDLRLARRIADTLGITLLEDVEQAYNAGLELTGIGTEPVEEGMTAAWR